MRRFCNALHIVDEAHVQHTVRFVEDEPTRLRKVYQTVTHQIGQTTRRGDQNVDARCDALDLGQLGNAAQHKRCRDMRVFGNIADRLFNLHGEFTRWCQDQRACSFWTALVAKADDLLQDRQAESCGLAGARLRDTKNIAAFKLVWNRLQLDRLRLGHASGFDALEQNAGNAEAAKPPVISFVNSISFGGTMMSWSAYKCRSSATCRTLSVQ